MTGIVVPETCWTYKKYNKIISSIYLVFILQLSVKWMLAYWDTFCYKAVLHLLYEVDCTRYVAIVLHPPSPVVEPRSVSNEITN